jgi:hypothetical protein
VNRSLTFEAVSEIRRDGVSLDSGIDSRCFATYCPKTELATYLATGSSKDSRIV